MICIKFHQKNKNLNFGLLRFLRFLNVKNLGFFEAIFQPWGAKSQRGGQCCTIPCGGPRVVASEISFEILHANRYILLAVPGHGL